MIYTKGVYEDTADILKSMYQSEDEVLDHPGTGYLDNLRITMRKKVIREVVEGFSLLYEASNVAFDKDRFRKACLGE